jgi:hypothetical protein
VIGSAAFYAAGGVAVWLLRRRKGDRQAGPWLLLVVPGVYLAFLSTMGEPRWLFLPGLALIAGAVLVQILGWRSATPRSDSDRGADQDTGRSS